MVPRVVVHEPDEEGGRRIHFDSQIMGLAYGERDVREFLRRAGFPDWEDVPLDDPGLFEWRGPGPEFWENSRG